MFSMLLNYMSLHIPSPNTSRDNTPFPGLRQLQARSSAKIEHNFMDALSQHLQQPKSYTSCFAQVGTLRATAHAVLSSFTVSGEPPQVPVASRKSGKETSKLVEHEVTG